MRNKLYGLLLFVLLTITTFSAGVGCASKARWDHNKNNWPPLFVAAYNGDVETMNKLMGEGVEVDEINEDSLTPLEVAVRMQQYDAVKVLLENHANVNLMVPEVGGVTPLMTACMFENCEVVKLLLEYGAEVNAVNISGWTPLKSAVSQGTDEISKLLIENGADINYQHEKFDETPLMLAVYGGKFEKAKILIEAGSDRDLATKDGGTAASDNEAYNKQDRPEIYEAIKKLLSE